MVRSLLYSSMSSPTPKPPQLQPIHVQVPLVPPLPCSPPITLPMSPIKPPTPKSTLPDNLYRRPKIPDQQPSTQPQPTIEEKLLLALALPFINFGNKISDPSKDEELKSILSFHRNGFWCPSDDIVNIVLLEDDEELKSSKYKDNVWCTSLVIKYLRQKVSDCQGEWVGLENNAMRWLLSQLCEGQSLEMLFKEAVYQKEDEWSD